MPPIPVSIFLVFLWHQNPSGKPKSRIVFQYGFDMMLRYEFDALWIWGYDFNTVFIELLIWFGLWFRYGFGMLWIWFLICFDTVLMRCWCDFDLILIWFRWVGFKQGNRNSPGTGFWSISRGFLWLWDVFKWFWYGFDRFWCDFEGMLMWYDFDMFSNYIYIYVYVYMYIFIFIFIYVFNQKKTHTHHRKPQKKHKPHFWPIKNTNLTHIKVITETTSKS